MPRLIEHARSLMCLFSYSRRTNRAYVFLSMARLVVDDLNRYRNITRSGPFDFILVSLTGPLSYSCQTCE